MITRLLLLSVLTLLLAGCGSANVSDNADTPQNEPVIAESTTFDEYDLISDVVSHKYVFTTTARIHESMPEFTFIRTYGNRYIRYFPDFPRAVEVNIEIKDEEGNIIQVITGLAQSNMGGSTAEITFEDYNFDGFLDMRLHRWQDSAGALRMNAYFWLWDNCSFQFVLNDELMNLARESSGLESDYERRQIITWRRIGPAGAVLFFEWQDEKPVIVDYSTTLHDDAPQYRLELLEGILRYYGFEQSPPAAITPNFLPTVSACEEDEQVLCNIRTSAG